MPFFRAAWLAQRCSTPGRNRCIETRFPPTAAISHLLARPPRVNPARPDPDTIEANADESSWRYPGWRVVAACFGLAVCAWGFGFYGHSVYLAELARQHGWSSGLISMATSFYYLVGGILVAFTGDAIRWLGPKRFVLLGLVAMAIATALIPQVSAPWQLYCVYLLMACGWAGTSLAAIVTIVGMWFHARRGMAISLALNGASAGSVIAVPLMVGLTAWLGFARALPLSALILVALVVPMLVAWVAAPPSPSAANPASAPPAQRWSRRRELASPAFWSAALPFALGIAAQAGFITHQIAVLEPHLGRVDAGFAVALTGASAIAGRVALSFFIDRWSPRHAAAVLLAIQAAALMMINRGENPLLLYAACAAFGLGVGNIITLPALVVQREFPAAVFGQVTSLATSVAGLTYAFAPAVLGILRDWTGTYTVPLYVCMGVEMLAAAIALMRPRAAR